MDDRQWAITLIALRRFQQQIESSPSQGATAAQSDYFYAIDNNGPIAPWEIDEICVQINEQQVL